MEITILSICCCLLLVMGFIVLIFLSFRIVYQHHRIVIFRLGHLIGERGPGLVLIIPITDKSYDVDLREQSKRIENIPGITIDGKKVIIDMAFSYKVIDPIKCTMTLIDTKQSVENRILAELRNYIGKLSNYDLYNNREKLILDLQHNINPILEKYGIELLGIDIIDIRTKDNDSRLL